MGSEIDNGDGPARPDTSQPVVRSVDFELRNRGDDGYTLEGYAAVFNTRTLIDSFEGRFEEQIAPGAFKKTLSERAGKVVLQFDHGQHPLVGSIPLGRIDVLREDERGLLVRARLSKNWMVEPVRDAIAAGAISGMSFRFQVMAEKWDDDGPVPLRTITELKLYEVGPVVFPAYEDTVVGVRALADAIRSADPNLRQQVIALVGDAPSPEAGDYVSATSGEGRNLDDAAVRHVVDLDAHSTRLARFRNHIPKDAA